MAVPHQRRRLSVDDYFEIEARSPVKHEFVGGEVLAMAGGSPRHNAIARNLLRAWATALRGGPCEVFGSDQRVALPEDDLTYPDLSVFCGPIVWLSGRPATGPNPVALVEVLSESTRDYDRGEKLEKYRRTASVRDVVLIETGTMQVEHWRRGPAGEWSLATFTDAAEVVTLVGGAPAVPLGELYEGVWALPA